MSERISHLYSFEDARLLDQALARGSKDSQRLEWLGDRVLSLCLSQILFRRYPDHEEGMLTRALLNMISNRRLSELGNEYGLIGEGGDRVAHKAAADLVEAVIGAVLIDGGMPAAAEFVEKLFAEDLVDEKRLWRIDAKTLLKEACEQRGEQVPGYEIEQSAGGQEGGFSATCVALGEKTTGQGSSKAQATMLAAEAMVGKLGLDDSQD